MKNNQINHNALTHLIEAGAVSVVIAKAMGDTWALTIQVGDTLKIVMAKNSGKPRVWRKLDTLAKYLKDLGVEKFHTDVSDYDPSLKTLRRPDSANTLKRTHKSHQSLQQQSNDTATQETVNKTTDNASLDERAQEQEQQSEPDSRLQVNISANEVKSEVAQVPQVPEVTSPVKLNTTDKAIQKAKERWEQRRMKILQEENPRAK